MTYSVPPSDNARATALTIAAAFTSDEAFLNALIDTLPELERRDHIAIQLKRAEVLGQMADRMLGAGPSATHTV